MTEVPNEAPIDKNEDTPKKTEKDPQYDGKKTKHGKYLEKVCEICGKAEEKNAMRHWQKH